jgi:MFS family permease
MSDTTAVIATDEDAGRLDNASNARIWGTLAALILFTELVPLQYAMVGLLLPKFGATFPASGNSTSWALTIIGVVGAATLALAGKASDLWGKKRTLLVLSAGFLVGTLLCATTHNWGVFLVGRGLEALSFCMPAVGYGIVRDLIPRRLVPIAMGMVATGLGASAVLAPLIGGLLTDHYSWQSVFWFLLIYTVITTAGLWIFVPESPYRVKQRFDVIGALLFGFGLAGVCIYVSEGSDWGWLTGKNLPYLLGGVVLLVVFVIWESRISFPIMELSLLRNPSVAIIMALAIFATIVVALPQLLIPYMFETPVPSALRSQIIAGIAAQAPGHPAPSLVAPYVHFIGDINYAAGFSVFQIAWHITLVTSLVGMTAGPIGGILARRYGARLPLILAGISLVASAELWARFHGAWADQALIGILWGTGFGFYYAGGPNVLIDAVPARRQGISSAMYASFGAIGSALGVALATPILAAHPYKFTIIAPGHAKVVETVPQVYTNNAYSWSYLLVGGLSALCMLLLAVALRTGRTPATGGIVLESPIDPASALETPFEEAPLADPPAAEAVDSDAASAEAAPVAEAAPAAEEAAPAEEPAPASEVGDQADVETVRIDAVPAEAVTEASPAVEA